MPGILRGGVLESVANGLNPAMDLGGCFGEKPKWTSAAGAEAAAFLLLTMAWEDGLL